MNNPKHLKSVLKELVLNTKLIKDNTSFKEQLILYNWICNLSENELNQLTIQNIVNEKIVVKIPPIPKKKVIKVLKVGIYVAAAVLPFGLPLYATVKFLVDAYNYKCGLDCHKKEDVFDKTLCYRMCDFKSKKRIVKELEKEFEKCETHFEEKKKKKCRDRLYKLLDKWKQELVEAEIKLQHRQKYGKLKKIKKK